MIEAQIPGNEPERLAALLAYDVLDTEPEQAYDDLTQIASEICGTPIALVSLVDSHRQWFKSKVGLDAPETPRELAFCSHAILEPGDILVITDSLTDERFHDNPLAVGDPHVRFYAGAPLVDQDGLAMGTLCVIDDVPRDLSPSQLDALRALSRQVVSQLDLRKSNSNLRELSRDVQRTNEELQQFTSFAAHDLREPLRKLVTFSGLLEQDAEEALPLRAKEDLGHIVDSAARMDRLVTSLLDLTRAGSGELENKPLALEDCVRQALDALGPCIDEKNAQIDIDPLPMVRGEQALLTQLFQNLLGNALKFNEGERARIRITCGLEDGVVVIGVKDDGIGMEPQYVEKIFDPFKRLHGRKDYDGTGIGLAIARKVVERHGGRIWVESTFGEGSHFRFTLAGIAPDAVTRAA